TFSVITLRHSMEFTLSPYTTLFRSATALTHQTDDDNFRLGETRHHAEQHAFADAGAGKQAQALPLADGQRRIDGANADIEHFADRLALQRVDYRPFEIDDLAAAERTFAVERATGTIDDAAEQLRTDLNMVGALQRHDAGAGLQTVEFFGGHQKHAVVGKTDDLGFDGAIAAQADQTAAADGHIETHGLQRHADHAHQPAGTGRQRY